MWSDGCGMKRLASCTAAAAAAHVIRRLQIGSIAAGREEEKQEVQQLVQ